MTSRRAQKRDGTRKSRQTGEPWAEYIRAEYDAKIAAWLADRSPFRPVNPPSPPVCFDEPTEDEKRRYEREYASIKSTDSQEGS